ncbi:MAG: glycosyltransferase family 4 protein [Candidatus Euphemobacter frigidus]|nr:glycosyltransferase family 4 protein [Candidatus Euphemobacter frigidus]MDP8276831.1 glycosyltransferase family 4 protein [Candidatus Euphemobacter frigidus]
MRTINSEAILFILPVPFFFSQAAGVGGHVAHVYGLLKAFARLGYELNIIAEESHPTIKNDRIKLFILPIGSSSISILSRQFWSWKLIQKVRQIVKQNRYQFCYIRYSVGFTPWLPILKRILINIPLVVEVNSFGTQNYNWLKFSDLWALHSADIIICISETLRKLMLAKISQKLDSKIIVLPNGVDIGKFEEIEPDFSFSKQKENIKLGYAGILKPDYGLDILLSAYSLVRKTRKDVSLNFFGDGPYYKSLKARADSMDGVTLHGGIPFEKMPGVLKSLDILCHTTAHKNAFQSPIKLYEYMAAGKPIVAAETPLVRELLGDNQRGLLYPIGDSAMLCKQILRLIANPDLGQVLAARAFKEVKENHSWQSRISKLLDELKQRGLIEN